MNAARPPATTPRLAARLAAMLAPPQDREFILGDLHEHHGRVARQEGTGAANRWYRGQVIRSIPRFVAMRLRHRHHATGGRLLMHVRSDLRFGLRNLRRDPLFAVASLTTLSLGIGATVALFSVVNAVLLRPPAGDDPRAIVRLFETRATEPGERNNMSYPDIDDVRARAVTLTDVIAKQSWQPTILVNGEPARLRGASVSGGFFRLLGVDPVIGRFFSPEENALGHDLVVVLSHHVWQERFGADSAVIGQTVELAETPYTIVGVAPADFEDPDGHLDLWRSRPSYFDASVLSRTGHNMRPIARIAPGYTIDQVNAELGLIAAALVEEFPEDKAGDGLVAVPMMDVLVGTGRTPILTLFAAVSILLLIACANVANLLLSRATARQREMAVRTALGAGPRRITSQLLTESLLLAALGGVGGVFVAQTGVRVFVAMSAAIPRAERITIDATVLGFTLVVTAVVGVLFGLVPALRSSRPNLVADLRDGERTVSAGLRGLGLRNGLVVGEIALSLILLTGAGLFIRSLANLALVDPGVRTENVLTMNVGPSESTYSGHADLTRFWQSVVDRITHIPGVVSAGAVSFLPMSGGYEGQRVTRDDRPPPEPGQAFGSEARAVTPDYLRTMGMRILEGRMFTAADDSASVPVAIVNQTFAARLYPGESPVNKSVTVQGISRRIVGVVNDVHQFGIQSEVEPEIFAPHAQPFVPWIRGNMDLVVWTEVGAASFAPAVRQAVWDIDGTTPISNVKTMERWASEDIAAPRFRTYLLTVFSGVALTLAVVGIGGLLLYSVSHRTREFGIRAALGATRGDLLRITLGHGMRITGLGILLGTGGSLLSARVLTTVLFGVEPTDPGTLSATAALLALVCGGAVVIPALRAGRVSPATAMQSD